MASEPALTVTAPAFPPPVPDAEVIPVALFCAVPSIESGPEIATVTLPPAPFPKVEAEIDPSCAIERELPATRTLPPAPSAKVEAEISPLALSVKVPAAT
jgi:hypothetical protein